eukprot:364189-Chlamydomonas_euryale.AAC.32
MWKGSRDDCVALPRGGATSFPGPLWAPARLSPRTATQPRAAISPWFDCASPEVAAAAIESLPGAGVYWNSIDDAAPVASRGGIGTTADHARLVGRKILCGAQSRGVIVQAARAAQTNGVPGYHVSLLWVGRNSTPRPYLHGSTCKALWWRLTVAVLNIDSIFFDNRVHDWRDCKNWLESLHDSEVRALRYLSRGQYVHAREGAATDETLVQKWMES